VLRWQAHSHVWGGTREINKKSTSRLFETGCIHVWDSVVQCPSAPSSFSWNALWSWTNAHALHQHQHQQNKKLKKTFKLTPPPQLPGLLTMPVPLAMVYHSNHVWVASDPIILCFDPYVLAPPLSSLRSQSSPQGPSMFCLTQPCTPRTDASVQGLLGLQGRGEDHDNRREGDLVGLDKHAHQSLEPTRGEHLPSLSLSLSPLQFLCCLLARVLVASAQLITRLPVQRGGDCVATLEGHNGEVLNFCTNGTSVWSCGWDKQVFLWDVQVRTTFPRPP
jgi:hypothetical protein